MKKKVNQNLQNQQKNLPQEANKNLTNNNPLVPDTVDYSKVSSFSVVTLVKYIIAIAVGTGILFLVLGLRKVFSEPQEASLLYKNLCDAFIIPGVILLSLGVLVWLSGEGALAGVAFALRHLVYTLIPGLANKEGTYKEYLDRRKAHAHGYLFLFVVGGIFFIVGIVFLILFYQVYQG